MVVVVHKLAPAGATGWLNVPPGDKVTARNRHLEHIGATIHAFSVYTFMSGRRTTTRAHI